MTGIMTMNSSSFISKRTSLAPQLSNLRNVVGMSVSSVRHPARYPLEGRAAVQGGSSLRTLCAAHRHFHGGYLNNGVLGLPLSQEIFCIPKISEAPVRSVQVRNATNGETEVHGSDVSHLVEALTVSGEDRTGEYNWNGVNPLWVACLMGHAPLVKFLIKAGADVGEKESDSTVRGHDADTTLGDSDAPLFETPLLAACRTGDVAIVEMLLEAGADVDKESEGIDFEFQTPLLAACRKGDVSVVELLLKAGADVTDTESGYSYRTPLTAACVEGHVAIVKLLLKAGANVDMSGYVGDDNENFQVHTPLTAACYEGHRAIVVLLLEAGAEVDKADGDGDTPLQIARRKGLAEVVELLLKAGATI